MKKLFTALLVGLSAIAVNGTAMAHSGNVTPYPVWNINFGAKPGTDGTSYIGPGVIWDSSNGADGVNNYWNYLSGYPVPNGSLSATGAPVFRATTYTENKGDLVINAPVAYTVDADLISGYIMSNATTDIMLTMTVPNFGSDSGHVYVYTEQGKETADLLGIAGSSTSVLNKMYTWSQSGITYDVYEYWVTSSMAGSISFTAHGIDASGARVDGYINAMQLTPIPPHPVPEPATVTLLGIGGLAGSIMLKRKRSAEA
jgi:hypothetical protein